MLNTTDLVLSSNWCYQPLTLLSFLSHGKFTSHPSWTQRSPLPIPMDYMVFTDKKFNSKHKYENIFTAILLKAEMWPLKADHFCLFENATAPSTLLLAETPSPLQNLHQQMAEEEQRKSKPFRSVSAKLRAARVRTCSRGTFSRSFMFDPESIQLLQARCADFPAGCISEAVCKLSSSASDSVGSEGSKYNQEFFHPVVVMDVASWCVSTLVSVKAWGSWNKRKQIPSEFLLSKQRTVQWANAFPGQYPTPVLQSHRTLIPAHCRHTSREKMLSIAFSFILVPFFSSFSPVTHTTLPLIITFQNWL